MRNASNASNDMNTDSNAAAFDRMKHKVHHTEATAQAAAELLNDDVGEKFAAMEKQEEIDRMVTDGVITEWKG